MKSWIYYKKHKIDFQLPEKWRILATLVPKNVSGVDDISQEVIRSISNPIASKRIQELANGAKKVTLIIDDTTRATPTSEILPPLLEILNDSGVSDERITIVMALGSHNLPSKDELTEKIGLDTLRRVNIELHDPNRNLKFVGISTRGTHIYINRTVMDSDLKIGIGYIKAHEFAGYSGGPKIIVPGVSGLETIIKNHKMILEPASVIGKRSGNPVWEDALEIARRIGLDFKIDCVLNMRKEVVRIFAGDVEKAQIEAIKVYDDIYRTKISKPADVTIVAGYPLDATLIQTMVGVIAANIATKDGGTIITMSACYNGVGWGGIDVLLERRLEPEEIISMVERKEQLPTGGPMVCRIRSILKTKKIVVVTDGIAKEKINAMNLDYVESLEKAIEEVNERYPQADVIVMPVAVGIPQLC